MGWHWVWVRVRHLFFKVSVRHRHLFFKVSVRYRLELGIYFLRLVLGIG